jgi:hypothetical protein
MTMTSSMGFNDQFVKVVVMRFCNHVLMCSGTAMVNYIS